MMNMTGGYESPDMVPQRKCLLIATFTCFLKLPFWLQVTTNNGLSLTVTGMPAQSKMQCRPVTGMPAQSKKESRRKASAKPRLQHHTPQSCVVNFTPARKHRIASNEDQQVEEVQVSSSLQL